MVHFKYMSEELRQTHSKKAYTPPMLARLTGSLESLAANTALLAPA